MSVSIKIVGGGRLHAALRKGQHAPQAARAALYKGAQEVFAESQRQTPVETGALIGSGVVTRSGNAHYSEARITYGGAAAHYALYVHEILDNYHPKGKAKFLEDPMTQMGPGVVKAIEQAVKDSL